MADGRGTAGGKPGQKAAPAGNEEKVNRLPGRKLVLDIVAFFKKLTRPWESAAGLFDYTKAGDVLASALPHADADMAAWVVLISNLIIFLIAAFAIASSGYLANFESQTVTGITGAVEPTVHLSDYTAPLTLLFLVNVPVATILFLLTEWCAFKAFRILGGKGTFAQQLYLSSIVGLAGAFASILNVMSPIMCLQLLGGIALILIDVYLALFVASKAYATAHQLPFFQGLVVSVVVSVLRVIVILAVMNFTAGLLGMPNQIVLPFDSANVGA